TSAVPGTGVGGPVTVAGDAGRVVPVQPAPLAAPLDAGLPPPPARLPRRLSDAQVPRPLIEAQTLAGADQRPPGGGAPVVQPGTLVAGGLPRAGAAVPAPGPAAPVQERSRSAGGDAAQHTEVDVPAGARYPPLQLPGLRSPPAGAPRPHRRRGAGFPTAAAAD